MLRISGEIRLILFYINYSFFVILIFRIIRKNDQIFIKSFINFSFSQIFRKNIFGKIFWQDFLETFRKTNLF